MKLDKKIKPLFLIQNFDVEYPNDFKRLRYEVDFPIYEKQVILFTGRSGVGKSTLFLLLKGILSKIYSCKIYGNIIYNDKDNYINIIDNYPQILEKKIGYLGQNPYTQIVNPKVIDELVFGMENYKFTKDEINKNAIFYSNLFGLTEKLSDKTKTLSGGLCQRLNLASILSYKPDILLLDEPVSFLDEDAARSFYEILKSLKGEKTIIIIEHIFDQILDIVDNILVFENEKEFSDEKLINRFNMKNYSIAK
ncbi:MAG: ABC transporter ATP-binding protein, partial [Spirochaetota bacterium]